MKIEIKRKKTENVTNMWKLNNTLLDNRIIKEKKKNWKYLDTSENRNKTYGMQQK